MMTLASPHRIAPLLSLLLTLAIPRAVAGQCVTKASSCTEFVPVGPGSERILVYRNRSLTTPNDTVTRALIVVHGAGGPQGGNSGTSLPQHSSPGISKPP